MKNLKQRLQSFGIQFIPFVLIAAAAIGGDYLDHRRDRSREIVQQQWERRMDELKKQACANSYHYNKGYDTGIGWSEIRMHGYDTGIGWSEERCPYAF